MKDKVVLLTEYGAKVLKLEGDLLYKIENLKKVDIYYFEQSQRVCHIEQAVKEVEKTAISLKDQMISLFDLVDTLKMECTKAYRNWVVFVVSSLMT